MLSMQFVGPLCLLGFCVFAVGAAAGSYMMVKTKTWTMAAIDKYQREKGRPRWPVTCVYLCLPLGIIIILGAILAN